MMKKLLLVSTVAFVVGACSDQSKQTGFEPGQWEVSAAPESVVVPGATDEQAEMFKSMLGQKQTQEQCLSEAEAKRGLEPLAEAFSKTGMCEVTDLNTKDGVIEGSLACNLEGGDEPAVTTIEGTYTPAEFAMKMKLKIAEEALPEGQADLTLSISGKRTGDC